jgi:phosphoribosylformylglycinamidine cyclo-ligase
VGDLVKTIIVDSTITVRMKRSDVVNLDAIQPGDCIIGFASFGQAAWETEYNSGIGSNGLTAARHDSLDHSYAERYPETFSVDIPSPLVYCGKGKVTDPLQGTPLSLGRALLSPTRTYAPLIKKLVQTLPGRIHGMIHCTGGGQTKCLNFGKRIHYIKDNLFPVPPVFNYLMESRSISFKEMYPVFNMGHRLEIFVDRQAISQVMACATECRIDARIIGCCEASKDESNHLTIRHLDQVLSY